MSDKSYKNLQKYAQKIEDLGNMLESSILYLQDLEVLNLVDRIKDIADDLNNIVKYRENKEKPF